jgi:hypothetical protein
VTVTKLEPLAYHHRVADAVASREKELWDWFRSDTFAEQYKRDAQLRLSKSAIQLGRDGNANNGGRYGLAESARDKLGSPATSYSTSLRMGAVRRMQCCTTFPG